MPKLGLRPYATIIEGLDEYLAYNFMRLENVHERMPDVTSGGITFTGTATIATSLGRVDGVSVCLASAPVAGACFLRAVPSAVAGAIDVIAYSNGFVQSVIAVSIYWVVVGELILS